MSEINQKICIANCEYIAPCPIKFVQIDCKNKKDGVCDDTCFIKQLQRLKQENKELIGKNDWFCEQLEMRSKALEHLKQALEEIREIAKEATNSKDCYIYMYAGRMYCEPILKKIDEVLND